MSNGDALREGTDPRGPASRLIIYLYKEAGGPYKAIQREYKGVEVTDGKLRIAFAPNVQNPAINGVEILADLCEIDDRVEGRIRGLATHSQDGAAQPDVLPATQLGMETRTGLEERSDPAIDHGSPLGRNGHP